MYCMRIYYKRKLIVLESETFFIHSSISINLNVFSVQHYLEENHFKSIHVFITANFL